MLEHYGRIQKADYDKIALACLEVNERKNKMPGNKVAQKASQYTAAGGRTTVTNVTQNGGTVNNGSQIENMTYVAGTHNGRYVGY